MSIQSRVRCAVCNAIRNFCHCPEDVPYSTSKDAGPCPDKVEDVKPKTAAERYSDYCDQHPDNHNCRIYD